MAATPHFLAAALALLGGVAISAHADSHLDVDYAEIRPLAAESMLLDVTRVGDRLVAVGERGHVVCSDDGEKWLQAENVPTRATLTTVFALGGRLWAGGHDAVIITSGDHGRTWTREHFDPEGGQAVMDLHFTDEQNGVAIGSYGLYLVTRDGRGTWEAGVVDEENEYHLNANTMLAFSGFLLALALVSVLGVGLKNTIISVGISMVPIYIRLVRGCTLSVKEQTYVEAARAVGTRDMTILLRHILPNVMVPITIQTSLGMGTAILFAAGLGFLGIGVQPPTPEWGAMLGSGRAYLFHAPHVATFPGIAIFLAVLGFNLSGDGLRDVLDPRFKL